MSEQTKPNTEYIFFKESAIESIISDIGSFLFLVGTFWFNYNFIGGNNYIDVLLLFMFIAYLHFKGDIKKKTFTNKKDLLKYVKEMK